jgi:hypothetical protein
MTDGHTATTSHQGKRLGSCASPKRLEGHYLSIAAITKPLVSSVVNILTHELYGTIA